MPFQAAKHPFQVFESALTTWPIAQRLRRGRKGEALTTGLTRLLFAAACMAPSSAWAACTVSNTGPTSIGSYPSSTVQAGSAVYTKVPAGFDCADALLTLLSGDSLSVTATSTQGFKLTSATTSTSVSYVLAADSAATRPIAPATKFYYLNGTLINLLGLLGNSVRNVPIYVKPTAVTEIAPGTYTGNFQLAWEWKLCTVAAVVCLGSTQSTVPVSATVSITMVVQAKPVGVVITTRTTWDPQSTTINPRAIPGSKQRTTITLSNPNIVAVDANTLAVVLPTPARGAVALDGDGTASTAYVTTAEGSPASTLGVTYSSPASQTDDIDFSSDGGTVWTYDPTTTPKSVTNVRIRPRGTMAAGSSFSVSLPYALF